VPVDGTDDHYPKDVKGRPVEPTKFTIRAEKCPNRRGVEQVLQQLQGEVVPFADVMKEVGSLAALYFAGGYPNPEWVNAAVPNQFSNPSLVVVQDLFRTKLTERADFVLPATTAFEKDGTFVNHAGLAQSFPRATTPGAEVRPEVQLAYDVAERRGLATVAAVRKELAAAVPAFAGLAAATNGKKLALATV
jgi:NADH-quinone oxidoreductase subunit G